MQEAAAAAGAAALGGAAPTLIFCGDLNSSLNEGVPGSIELLRSGRLAADHPSFLKGVGFVWSKGVGTEAEAAEQGAAAAQPQGLSTAARGLCSCERGIDFTSRHTGAGRAGQEPAVRAAYIVQARRQQQGRPTAQRRRKRKRWWQVRPALC